MGDARLGETAPAEMFRGNLDKLVNKINEERGIDLSQYRRPYLERRLAARLRVLELHSYRQYADRLDQDPSEYDSLMNTLTINVTEFFRDKVVWDSLRVNVLKPLIAAKREGRNRTIRIWSAGCATGEEPYSLTMLMLDLLGDDAKKFLLSVTATDLDPRALETARKGVYDSAKLRRIPPGYQVRFVRVLDREHFEIAPAVRDHVRFSEFNLFDEPPLRVVDLIVCRNVFIYFDRDQQARVLRNFQASLARGGYLVLGRSEKLSPDAASALEAIDGRERIYRRPARA